MRRQNDGINARSIGDEMPSTVCAADGAMIWPRPSLPRLRRSGEAKFQPGLSSDARSDGSRAIVPKKVHRAQKKKAPAPPCLVNRWPCRCRARSHGDGSGQLPLRQPRHEAIRRLDRELPPRITDGSRQIDKARAAGPSVSVRATCRRTLPHGGIRSVSKSAIRRNQHPRYSQKPTRSAS